MKTLFFLENGIGYGHFQRSLLIADELKKRGHEIFFIVQASSVKIFEGRGFVFFRLPFTHRLPNNQSEKIIFSLLNKLVQKINPDIIIEDTHPNEKFLSLPEVLIRKKALILRRICPTHFYDQVESGIFNEYDSILLVGEKWEFVQKSSFFFHIIKYSDKFFIVGPIFREKTIGNFVHEKYFEKDKINVVIAFGAGGNHFGEDNLYKIVNEIIEVNKSKKAIHSKYNFLIFKGVYFKETIEIPEYLNNVHFLPYEKDLNEVISRADIVILRPGFNSVYESLSGSAFIIFSPSFSYMEDQERWLKLLCKKYDGAEIQLPGTSLLDTIFKASRQKKYTRKIKSAHKKLADVLQKINEDKISNTNPGLLLSIEGLNQINQHLISQRYDNKIIFFDKKKHLSNIIKSKTLGYIKFVDNRGEALQTLSQSKLPDIIFVRNSLESREYFSEFNKSDPAFQISVICITTFSKQINPGTKFSDIYRLFLFLLSSNTCSIHLIFDNSDTGALDFIDDLVAYFSNHQKKPLIDLNSYVSSFVNSMLASYKWNPKSINCF